MWARDLGCLWLVLFAAAGPARVSGDGVPLLADSGGVRHQNGLHSVVIPDGPVRAINFQQLRLRIGMPGKPVDAAHSFCGIVAEVKMAEAAAMVAAPPSLELDCYSNSSTHMADLVQLGWADEAMFRSVLVPQLIHRSAWSHMALIKASALQSSAECTSVLRRLTSSCNLVLNGTSFTDKGDRVSMGESGGTWRSGSFVPAASESAFGTTVSPTIAIAAAVAAAERSTHVAEQAARLVASLHNATHSATSKEMADERERRVRWHERRSHTRTEHRSQDLTTLRLLSPLWADAGNVRDMALSSDDPHRRDIGESLHAQAQSCMQLSTMETTALTLAISDRLSTKLRSETTFPSFLLRPLMTALLAPISQQIEKKTSPFAGPLIALIFCLIMMIPLCCHMVGLLCHKMGYHLADVLTEAINFKTTDYIVKAVEGTLARDISSVMMTSVVKWYSQSVIPEASNKLADLMPAVITPGLSAAVSNGVVMGITKPLTHALKAPVLGYYYCQYCYSYGAFCDFCVSDDIDKLENAWWLDI